MASARELRDQSVEQLQAMHEELRAALFGLRNERKQTGKLERPHEVRAAKKDLARILTILREKRGNA